MSLSKSFSRAIKSTCHFAQRSLSPVAKEVSVSKTLGLVSKENLPNIPLASVEDTATKLHEHRDWRAFFSKRLEGAGLEIGPLHRPMITHSGMKMHYVDRYTVQELRDHYPELREFSLVEPHIIDDAETLKTVDEGTYDFLIAAHVIEHMKNPLSSLKEWCRVIKPNGLIYMIVPDKRKTFDSHRVRTTVSHMVLDYLEPSSERDFEHYLDYAIHVHQKTNPDEAIAEAKRLLTTDYSIHFHVFMPQDVVDLLQWFSSHVRPLEIVEGPHMSPGSDEFHFLLKVGSTH